MILYQESDIEQILEAINKKSSRKKFSKRQKKKFAEELDTIAVYFIQRAGEEKRDPPSSVLKKLNTIAKKTAALDRLLKTRESASALHRLHAQATFYRKNIRVRTTKINSKGKLEEHTEPPSFPTIQEVRNAIKSLDRYARQAISREKRYIRPSKDKARNKGNAARQVWVNALAGLWSDFFNELPGVSLDPYTNKPSGPFFRFVMACYLPLKRECPGLPVLRENSVRAHFRKTGEAKLKRLF